MLIINITKQKERPGRKRVLDTLDQIARWDDFYRVGRRLFIDLVKK